MLYDPVRKMPLYYNSFQQATGASQEIFRFIDEQDELPEKKKGCCAGGVFRMPWSLTGRYGLRMSGRASGGRS